MTCRVTVDPVWRMPPPRCPMSTQRDAAREWLSASPARGGAPRAAMAGVLGAHPPAGPPSAAAETEARHRHRQEKPTPAAASLRSPRGAGSRARGSARAVASGGAAAACASARGPGLEAGRRPYCTVLIVPTGIGAAVGGCAGDALPVARAFAEGADCLVTHPNVMNGAMLFWPIPNALYVEGYGLDRFAAGEWGLQPVHSNKVGLVLDVGIGPELMQRHLQAADAARATLGIPMPAYTLTAEPLQVEKWLDPVTGASTGRLGAEASLLEAVGGLVEREGVEAVALVARFPDDSEAELQEYREGSGVDALAGVEAVISHRVVEHFGIPAAHAPALPPLPLMASLAPRSAAEETGYTFLPCVLAGLARAPRLVPRSPAQRAPWAALHAGDEGGARESAAGTQAHLHGAPSALWADDVDCVVLPATAFGGAGTQALARRRKRPLFIAVEENTSVMGDPASKFGIPAVSVANYWEALGVMMAHKAGVDHNALRAHGIAHIPRVQAGRATPRQHKASPSLVTGAA